MRTAEYSAVGWCLSLVLHLLLVGSLMMLTFSQFLSDTPGTDESFTVELTGPAEGSRQELVLSLTTENSNGNTPTMVNVAPSPINSQAIVLSQADNTEVGLSLENVELTAAQEVAGAFNESLSGSDTGGSAGFFGLLSQGSSFVYVIDRSGSMQGEKISAAIRELCRSVRALNKEMKFYLIFYNDSHLSMNSSKMVVASQDNKNKYLSWTDNITGEGGTEPTTAMKLAISLHPDVIWLLSDGEFPEEVVGTIKQANNRKIKINTLAFGNGAGQTQLINIAEQNNGKFKFIKF